MVEDKKNPMTNTNNQANKDRVGNNSSASGLANAMRSKQFDKSTDSGGINIQQELANCKKENAELLAMKEKLLIALANEQNSSKITKKNTEEQLKYAGSSFVGDVFDPLDDLFLAIENVDENLLETNESYKALYSGIKITWDNIIKVFDKHQIKRIYPLNEKFDHSLHHAISQMESNSPDGTVVKVFKAGCIFKDRVLKPAAVSISSNKKTQ